MAFCGGKSARDKLCQAGMTKPPENCKGAVCTFPTGSDKNKDGSCSMDLNGAAVFRQNRQLNPDGLTTREPVEHLISHTFIYTTNPDGSLLHTYSWGNEYTDENPSHWYRDRLEDIYAAQEAIKQREEYETASWYEKIIMPDNFGDKVGETELVESIESAYRQLRSDNSPSAHE